MICAYVDLPFTIYAQVLGSFAGSLFVPLDIRGTLPVARISPKQFHFFHPFLGVLEMYSVWNLSYFLMGICTSIKKDLIVKQKLIALMSEELGFTTLQVSPLSNT